VDNQSNEWGKRRSGPDGQMKTMGPEERNYARTGRRKCNSPFAVHRRGPDCPAGTIGPDKGKYPRAGYCRHKSWKEHEVDKDRPVNNAGRSQDCTADSCGVGLT
jgi:hypothetical protein